MRFFGSSFALLVAASLCVAPALADSKPPKPVPTELSKAIGGCVMSVAIGALAGALLGGRNHRGAGIALGASAGGLICAKLVKNAKHQDRIIAAQAAAAARDGLYQADLTDDSGNAVRFEGQSSAVMDPGNLRPVRYQGIDGAKRISPDLSTSARICRRVSSSIVTADGSAELPSQLYCRTASGDYEPYASSST